jgi:chromosome segregation ATPase
MMQIDSKVDSETALRKSLQADFESRMKCVDWQCYSEELGAACEELQEWRDKIEADRTFFKSSLSKEIEGSLSDRIDDVRRLVAEESKVKDEIVKRLETQCQEVSHNLNVEMASRSSYSKSINEILEVQGDERNRLVACFNTERAEVQALNDKIVTFAREVQDIKNSVAAGNVSLVSIPKTEANLQQSEEPQDRSNASQEALAQEVNKLKDQVKQTPPLLLELTMQLHQLQQGLSGEKDERNIALENLSRKLDLVGTVYNLDSAQGKAENGGQGSQRHDEQLRLIFDKLDSLANDQLSVLREQVANCSKQLSMEQAERKSDSEMVWSSMQNLHGHLVQFISQPPPTAMTIMPESQRSLGGNRMPRSRSPSPRFPGQMPEHLLASRPRVPVRLPDALKEDTSPQLTSPRQEKQRSSPADPNEEQESASYQASTAPGKEIPVQLPWTSQDAAQNISLARQLLQQHPN